jgi:hypothetical protein
MEKYTYISKDDMLCELEERIKYHEQQMEYANSFSWRNGGARLSYAGHAARAAALRKTYTSIQKGERCARSIAQLFGKGARLLQEPLPMPEDAELDKIIPF